MIGAITPLAQQFSRSLMQWQELADLPFAAMLEPHDGALPVDGSYDTVHFDHLTVTAADGSSSSFLECAVTHVTFDGGYLRRARFTDVWLRDVRMTATSLAESSWIGSVITQSALSGAEAYGAVLRDVALRGCKLDSVSFRGARLTDVVFENCVLRDVDFTEAELTRVSFPGCTLAAANLTKVRLDSVDLRGAELGLIVDPPALRGAIVTPAQLALLAPVLASNLGIRVEDR
jgi:uncharacterized protein YjbI with pentapeptide repeats